MTLGASIIPAARPSKSLMMDSPHIASAIQATVLLQSHGENANDLPSPATLMQIQPRTNVQSHEQFANHQSNPATMMQTQQHKNIHHLNYIRNIFAQNYEEFTNDARTRATIMQTQYMNHLDYTRDVGTDAQSYVQNIDDVRPPTMSVTVEYHKHMNHLYYMRDIAYEQSREQNINNAPSPAQTQQYKYVNFLGRVKEKIGKIKKKKMKKERKNRIGLVR